MGLCVRHAGQYSRSTRREFKRHEVYSTEGETGAGVRHSVEWDALDNNGNPVEPGRYNC